MFPQMISRDPSKTLFDILVFTKQGYRKPLQAVDYKIFIARDVLKAMFH